VPIPVNKGPGTRTPSVKEQHNCMWRSSFSPQTLLVENIMVQSYILGKRDVTSLGAGGAKSHTLGASKVDRGKFGKRRGAVLIQLRRRRPAKLRTRGLENEIKSTGEQGAKSRNLGIVWGCKHEKKRGEE